MSAPPIPPRPASLYDPNVSSGPPPVPPLPPNFRPDIDISAESPPHFADPMVAPRPQKLMSSVPADMARTLENQISMPAFPVAMPSFGPPPALHAPPPPPADMYRRPSPAPNPAYFPPAGFSQPLPPRLGPSPAPVWGQPPIQPVYSPAPPPPTWAPVGSPVPQHVVSPPPVQYSPPRAPQQLPYQPPVPVQPPYQSMAGLTLTASPKNAPPPLPYSESPRVETPPSKGGPPSLTASQPTVETLTAALPSILTSQDITRKVGWCKDVLALVDKTQQSAGASASDPVRITDPAIIRLTDNAIQTIINITNSRQTTPLPLPIAEAIYLRGTLSSSGSFPAYLPLNPRDAFRDFEASARAGYHQAWFKLGRDYENVGDLPRAKECFERGVRYGVGSCFYRMGMAHLQGQLGLPPNPVQAIPLIQRAASLATTEVPQPAYVYALLLQSEFPQITLSPHVVQTQIPPGSSIASEARKYLERAAYLGFAPAQYKLGHAYEFATPPFPFDALLSVQYYSLASQQGEVEADMALSKWFLCGAEGAFEKDEALAYTFAEKAARKGLPSAEFALGYYAEVGVGGPKNLELARKWYEKAAKHGNADAPARLQALSLPQPQSLSRAEHEAITDNKLIRRRTQAKEMSAASGRVGNTAPGGHHVVEAVRKSSLAPPLPDYDTPSSPVSPSGGGRPGAGPGRKPQPHKTQTQSQQQQQQHHPLPQSPLPQPAATQHSQPPANHSKPTPSHGGRVYALSDGPSPTSTPGPLPSPVVSSSGRPTSAGKPDLRPQNASSPPNSRPNTSSGQPHKGPATFAEMGFQSQKLEDKECVIM